MRNRKNRAFGKKHHQPQPVHRQAPGRPALLASVTGQNLGSLIREARIREHVRGGAR